EAGTTIHCQEHLEAGWGIKALGAIVAGGAIKAGESLQTEATIRAGDGYGIYAGLNVSVEVWEASAWVRARELPNRLFSGHWQAPATS
ncbi:MAG: hypothetical protein J0I46_08845, partial [Thiobacillus sp.]|nr:hypothetical protein [Thiobacillus sp.]